MLVKVIKSELVLGQVYREVLPINSAAGPVHALRIAPESLDLVDVRRPLGVGLGVVDRDVLAESAQVVVAHELVGVEHRAFDRRGLDLGHQGLLLAVGHDDGVDPPGPLQDAEDGHFPGRTTAPLALAPAAEV
ncbi:hypothetical protein EP7_001951 [Isosphaeraceae bacterium EP7]